MVQVTINITSFDNIFGVFHDRWQLSTLPIKKSMSKFGFFNNFVQLTCLCFSGIVATLSILCWRCIKSIDGCRSCFLYQLVNHSCSQNLVLFCYRCTYTAIEFKSEQIIFNIFNIFNMELVTKLLIYVFYLDFGLLALGKLGVPGL